MYRVAYLKGMGYWSPVSRFAWRLALQGAALFADQANWERNMDIALQAAARQDYALSENAFVAAVRELELLNPADPRLGPTINSLGLVYRAENKLKDAERAFRRALFFIEKTNTPKASMWATPT